jgi:hypothetical protein
VYQDVSAMRSAAPILLVPLAAGALAPWAAWVVAGGIGLWAVVGATFMMASAYLLCVQWLGDREAVLRRKLGRRYQPPPPDMAAAVCFGPAFSFLLPGLSAGALADTVGFPRVEGTVSAYIPAELALTGARIALSPQAMPPGSRLSLLPKGEARITVPRFGKPVEFALAWRAQGSMVCLDGRCLKMDRGSGRLRVPTDGTEVGRVAAVGAVVDGPAEHSGVPWEIGNLFSSALRRAGR